MEPPWIEEPHGIEGLLDPPMHGHECRRRFGQDTTLPITATQTLNKTTESRRLGGDSPLRLG